MAEERTLDRSFSDLLRSERAARATAGWVFVGWPVVGDRSHRCARAGSCSVVRISSSTLADRARAGS